MLANKKVYGYSRNKKYITGRGFVDAMSSIFNSLKTFGKTVAPAFRSVGTYVSTNRDLIAKPVLGGIGSLAATGLTVGVPALLSHIMNKNLSQRRDSAPPIPDDPKYKEILQSIMTPTETTSVSNIIGSGVLKARVRRRGSGIKTF
jgi:hypothetical protein